MQQDPSQAQQPQSYPYPQQPMYAQQPPPPPPAKPRKKLNRGCLVGSIIIGVLVAIGFAAAVNNGGSATTTTQPTPATTAQAQATAVATKSAFATFGDGTFTVGKDIQPGTYRTRVGATGCYYARLKGFGGTVSDIINNDTTDGPAIVTISASDKGFQSTNCGTWTADISAITTSKTSFSDGTYFVGTDIQPGTYKNSGSSGCYYARLSGFGGTIGEIIANDTTDTTAIITIAAGDKGFTSSGCGTWTKQ